MSGAGQSRQTILVLVLNHVARDARVLRHIQALSSDYDVVTCGYGEAPPGVEEHLRIDVPRLTKVAKIAEHGQLLARQFERHYWGQSQIQQVAQALAATNFDAILANDIDTLPVALELAAGRPVFIDMHEYAPRWRDNDRRWMLFKAPYMDYLCRRYLPQAAAHSTVAGYIAQEYRKQYGVEFATITNSALGRQPQPRPTGAPIRLIHSGSSAANRQLEVMIEGAAMAPDTVLDMYLVPGSDRRYLQGLKSLAAATTNVRVLDPVPVEELPELHDKYDVGLSVLSTDTFNTRFSLPNKLFDYVQSGLGIVVGPSPEMAAVVDRYRMGAVLDAFSSKALGDLLKSLDAAQVDRWKAATCEASDELSGERQAEILRRIIGQLLVDRRA